MATQTPVTAVKTYYFIAITFLHIYLLLLLLRAWTNFYAKCLVPTMWLVINKYMLSETIFIKGAEVVQTI